MGLNPHMEISRQWAIISMKESPGNYNDIRRKESTSDTVLIRLRLRSPRGLSLPGRAALVNYKAALHTHPIELVAMSHTDKFLEKDVLTNLLWSMIPETKAFCPRGLGIVRYELPGSQKLAEATLAQLDDYDVTLWEKHGVCAVGCDIMEAFDQVDVLNKSAQIYINAKCMGYEPDGMSLAQMQEMTKAFNLPK